MDVVHFEQGSGCTDELWPTTRRRKGAAPTLSARPVLPRPASSDVRIYVHIAAHMPPRRPAARGLGHFLRCSASGAPLASVCRSRNALRGELGQRVQTKSLWLFPGPPGVLGVGLWLGYRGAVPSWRRGCRDVASADRLTESLPRCLGVRTFFRANEALENGRCPGSRCPRRDREPWLQERRPGGAARALLSAQRVHDDARAIPLCHTLPDLLCLLGQDDCRRPAASPLPAMPPPPRSGARAPVS